jgi:hypothetical protein
LSADDMAALSVIASVSLRSGWSIIGVIIVLLIVRLIRWAV